ncbi:hypothetical protein F4819DRAFT_479151 [Hypoxylon fuscum]|nr:hypothetical protein F4819DRAFT_479151 [Hypoxylon fuscum]
MAGLLFIVCFFFLSLPTSSLLPHRHTTPISPWPGWHPERIHPSAALHQHDLRPIHSRLAFLFIPTPVSFQSTYT